MILASVLAGGHWLSGRSCAAELLRQLSGCRDTLVARVMFSFFELSDTFPPDAVPNTCFLPGAGLISSEWDDDGRSARCGGIYVCIYIHINSEHMLIRRRFPKQCLKTVVDPKQCSSLSRSVSFPPPPSPSRASSLSSFCLFSLSLKNKTV